MELTVVIVPLPDQSGYSASLAAPLELSAEAPTAEEAQQHLSSLLQEKMNQGVRLSTLHVDGGPAQGGWLPDDDLTQEWVEHMKHYRAECDAADSERLATDRLGESLP